MKCLLERACFLTSTFSWFLVGLALIGTRAEALPPEYVAQLPTEVAHLIRCWDSMSRSVVTSQLTCRHLVIVPEFPFPAPPAATPLEQKQQAQAVWDASLTRRDFIRLFNECLVPHVESDNWAETMTQETARLLESTNAKVDHWWQELSIVDDGQSLRNEVRFDGGETDCRVRKIEGELWYESDANQATILDKPSAIRMYRHTDIRFFPEFRRTSEELLRAVLVPHATGSDAFLKIGTTEYDVDPRTGFVLHWLVYLPPQKAPAIEIWQRTPKEFPGGVVFPVLAAHVKFVSATGDDEPRLDFANVFVLRSANFNEEISQEHFKVAAPKGAVIANLTDEVRARTEVITVKAESDLPDITTVPFPARPRIEPPGPPGLTDQESGRRSRLLWPLMFANLVTIGILAGLIWFRRSRSRRQE